MTKNEVMAELKSYGNEGTKKVFIKHGAREPFYGVKVQDLKKIVKKVKKDYELSLELYETGNSDAMYLAGLIADENKISKQDLQKWAEGAYWYMISEYTVPWVAAESKYGFELALEWIESDSENIASSGWATFSNLATTIPDNDLDLPLLEKLLDRVVDNIQFSRNRVRYTMNGFVIAVGASITSLTNKALKVGEEIGKVEVNMGGTACKVPLATEYIKKVIDKGRVGVKRKGARC